MRSDKPAANLKEALAILAIQNKRSDLDLYASQALSIYAKGVEKGDSLPVILAKIEEHRLYVLGVLETARRFGRQPSVDACVYCTDCESKIRMLLKNICARHLRIFLLSIRKNLRQHTKTSPRSELRPLNNEKDGRVAPAA
jgi:hypothetical protein